MASFWTHIPKAIETVVDNGEVRENNDNIQDKKLTEQNQKQRCVCAKVFPFKNFKSMIRSAKAI